MAAFQYKLKMALKYLVCQQKIKGVLVVYWIGKIEPFLLSLYFFLVEENFLTSFNLHANKFDYTKKSSFKKLLWKYEWIAAMGSMGIQLESRILCILRDYPS